MESKNFFESIGRPLQKSVDRRGFLRYVGSASAAVTVIGIACKKMMIIICQVTAASHWGPTILVF